ncbi:MAG: UDP-N-acetylglucosamine pyrophosphorylase [Euryarchaeota archaeon]|jgi:NDP-sugar pyrophosphorylase family protein|nr:UDP-N-acetylglucosamine pyrophosphorylase [Deltaproteobacteria bacterium]MBQ59582.1 UDP-N-acetylglucosamine pyrophosphorylase [Euryarchaeota archaeon]
MEWPREAFSETLFPSLSHPAPEPIPILPESQPSWTILDKSSANSLQQQMDKLVSNHSNSRDLKKLPSSITLDESNGPVIIEQSAIVEPSTHFIGPCYIGNEAVIRHGAYVREYSWICSTAVVGHASEVKHSILLPGAKAPHFNYVGDSILGKAVNLGAGVKLSNLRNDGEEVFLRIGDDRRPSGLRKFGAILGEGCQLGCNAVTNPGTILGRNSTVWPNVTVTGVHGENSNHR